MSLYIQVALKVFLLVLKWESCDVRGTGCNLLTLQEKDYVASEMVEHGDVIYDNMGTLDVEKHFKLIHFSRILIFTRRKF